MKTKTNVSTETVSTVFTQDIKTATNPDTNGSTLWALAERNWDSFSLCSLIVKHANCPASLLEKFVKAGKLQEKVAQADNCPDSLLETLAHSNNIAVQLAVARRPNCPKLALLTLATMGSRHVCFEIAKLDSLDKATAVKLAGFDDMDVLGALAANESAPQEGLEALAGDWTGHTQTGYDSVCDQLLANQASGERVLELLWENRLWVDDEALEYALVVHPNTPDRLFEKLPAGIAAKKNPGRTANQGDAANQLMLGLSQTFDGTVKELRASCATLAAQKQY